MKPEKSSITVVVGSREVPGELCAGLSVGPVWGRASWYRKCRSKDQTALPLRIRNFANTRPRFGYLRIWVLLRHEGWVVNCERVRRWYRLDGYQLRMRVQRRKHIALHRGPAPVPASSQMEYKFCAWYRGALLESLQSGLRGGISDVR